MSTIAVIGLGVMGSPMPVNLQRAGLRLSGRGREVPTTTDEVEETS